MLVGSTLAKQRSLGPFHVTLVGAVEEEGSSAGVKSIIESGNSYDLAVFGEPSGASNVVIGYKGSLQLQVICLTKGGHSASPWLSKSSYEKAFGFWNTLQDALIKNDSSSKFSAVTGCITSATAGNGSNTIPSRTTLEIDIRIPPGLQAAELTETIRKFASQYEEGHQDVHLQIVVKDQSEAFLGSDNSIAVRAFRWAIRKTIGEQVALVKKTGTSDMNLFAKSYSLPMVAYGPGDSSLDHTENEHVSLSEYLTSIEVLASAIQHFASLAHHRSVPSNYSAVDS
jgi:LysW-gamma-L-lysine carboxypeptidase